MRIALCNEVLAPWPFARQCEWAAALGYEGLELAPFTLGDDAWKLPAAERAALRRAASDAGIAISGLHWLLRQPEGLSITSPDATVRARTLEVLRGLIDLCADLGGAVLVHGSPAQRRLPADDEAAGRERAIETFATVAAHAQAAGVTYCIEPLAAPEADFLHTVAEAAAVVQAIDRPALRTMLDCCAAARAEAESVHEVLARWLPTGLLAHVQVNDPNLRGPGQGAVGFADILRALRRHGYAGWIAVEPFDYHPDGPACAARAIGYLKGLLEALD
ncbi:MULTISPECIES: sugar phosphate isomerase/epimerase family protein [Hydrogenophaga]|uniref:Xylose isomerase domain-containing protein TIM barrel n=1 Tax=Hydrogenophaga intermedia TaxID=65786 RepID=A0A1L1PPG9_HYDIT|nr:MULTISPECIES: sugar phosphate isomerase/epimerase family protein [Hydrogenophaga]AOS81580.1 xylose isomerase [Hydrogenophaga sp. PBC]TMU73422.1 sugar phosphate isomerase/epimerase [Hydrogenophaga intermedia]CDN89599.1 Xylose isomerase domain-containing protein TIM barrel [Hydrogenophaga intermedia]